MWYFEEKNFFGRWTPQKSPKKPDPKRAEGRKRELRRVTKLDPKMADLPLGALERIVPDLGKPGVTITVGEVRRATP